MQLSPTRQNAFFRRMGHPLSWRRAYACPCVSPTSGAADPKCVYCAGKGAQWAPEDPETTDSCGFTAQNAKKAQADFGTWEPGDAMLSIPSDSPMYAAGRYDRFRSTVAQHRFDANLRAGFNDRLNGSIISVERVFWLNSTKDIVEGDLPAIADNGALTWADGQVAPPEGTVYSVSATRWDEYFAYLDLPQNRPIHGLAQPRKLPVRRFDIFGRGAPV